MILTVKERGQFVATMRHIHVWLMETLAAWVPTSPEMEVKLLFGEHIWDVAQHADALGKRTAELRMPSQHSLEPVTEYLELLADAAKIEGTGQRLATVYDILIPAVAVRYKRYLKQTDTLADAPSVRILDRHIYDISRMLKSYEALQSEVPTVPKASPEWIKEMQAREAAITNLIAIKTEVAA